MKNLKGYVPADAYFRGRLWWRCGIIRQTTGLSSAESAITVVNAPCIITSLSVATRQTEWTRINEPAPYTVIIPASYIKEETLHNPNPAMEDRIYLTWGPDGDINTSDVVYVHGLPFLLRIVELRNPLSLFSHFTLSCNPITSLALKVFSDFQVPFSVYRPIEPPEDIMGEILEVFNALMNQIVS